MKNYYLFFLLLMSCSLVKKNSTYPNLIGKNKNTISKIEKWKTLASTKGFLNNNQIEDYAFVLESKDSILEKKDGQLKQNIGRVIVVVIDDKIISQNNDFIIRGDDGGMLNYISPELKIENKQLSIINQFTRDNSEYIFEFNNENMMLVKHKFSGVHPASGNYENLIYDFKNLNLKIEKGNISEDKTTEETINLETKNKSLLELKEPYSWEVLPGRFI